ncbi:hypothetical protein D3C78_1187360 [compost metagenome]
MHTVTGRQTNKGAVNAAIFFFCIQALNVGRSRVDCCRQVSQRTLVVEHIHLNFGDELLLGLFIPLNGHKLLRLFLIATDVTAGFVVDDQAFARAHVRDDWVARNRSTAFREGNQYTVCAFDR